MKQQRKQTERKESKSLKRNVIVSKREEILKEKGIVIVSPQTNSMYPFVQALTDQAVFERPEKRLRKYDVALYKRDNRSELLMHRVMEVLPNGYMVRGDNLFSNYMEFVPEHNVLGVMIEIYKKEEIIQCKDLSYRLKCIVWASAIKYLYSNYKTSHMIFWRGVRYIKRRFL